MKKLVVLCVVGVLVGAANADVISVNWKQYAGAVNDPTEPYGVASASNWSNLQLTATSQTDLILSGGAASTVDMTMTNPGGFNTVSGGGVYDNTVFRTGALVYASPLTLSLSDLGATFGSNPYDIIVYGTGFNGVAGGNQGVYSDGTTTYYMQRPNPVNASFVMSTDTNSGDDVDVANYVRFSGLSGDTQTITVSTVNGNTGIGGFQIVGEVVPEPATMVLLGLGSLIGLKRRK